MRDASSEDDLVLERVDLCDLVADTSRLDELSSSFDLCSEPGQRSFSSFVPSKRTRKLGHDYPVPWRAELKATVVTFPPITCIDQP